MQGNIIETKASRQLTSVQQAIGQLILYKECVPDAEMCYASLYGVSFEIKEVMAKYGIKYYDDVFCSELIQEINVTA